MHTDIWTYREKSELGSNVMSTHADISGFSVEALDGSIGKVDDATYDVGMSYLIVDTGPWIFGRKVLLPAGVVRGIDEPERPASDELVRLSAVFHPAPERGGAWPRA